MNILGAIQHYLPHATQPGVHPGGPVQPQPLPRISPAELRDVAPLVPLKPTGEAQGAPSFGGMLGQLAQEVSAKQGEARDAVHSLMKGDPVSLHQVMISMEEAGLSFQLMVEVRNKLLEAYQELMRMQI